MSDVTIYTTGPGCFQCKLAKDRFDAAGATYTEVNGNAEASVDSRAALI